MRQFKIYSIFLILALLSSCGKDDYMEPGDPEVVVVEEMISGSAMLDTDGDGIGDAPAFGSFIYLADSTYKAFDPDTFVPPAVLSAMVDQDGQYLFDGVAPFDGKALFFQLNANIGNPINFEIVGIDSELDGDFGETDPGAKIYIDLETDEVDNGNDFVITRQPINISGSVLVDADLDGVGELPIVYKVALYERLPSGLPSTELVAQSWASNGSYEFYGIDPGEYVLVLEDNNEYYVFDSGDATPDPDGIADPNMPLYIPVDLEQGEVDADNNYILRTFEMGSIQGFVGDDLDLDGAYDFGLRQIWVGLIDQSTGSMIANVNTDEYGAYSFNSLSAGTYSVQILDADDFQFVLAGDFSNDGDPIDETYASINNVSVVLAPGETDSDNNFHITIESGRVSGRVLDDTDGDGIGDTPVWNDVLIIYFRDNGGGPITMPGAPWQQEVTYSDVNGYYDFGKFDPLPDTGEFVIHHIGSGAAPFDCISSEDLSPETGEPQNQHPECFFIQCDLPQLDSEDHHNVFVIDIQ